MLPELRLKYSLRDVITLLDQPLPVFDNEQSLAYFPYENSIELKSKFSYSEESLDIEEYNLKSKRISSGVVELLVVVKVHF